MIRVKNLGKQFGDLKAVDGITFDVENGEIFGFLGPNGAGKTTTIRMLTCIIKPTTGNAWLNGFNIRENPMDIRQMVGVLTENPCLYERLTPLYNLDFFGKIIVINKKIKEDPDMKKMADRFRTEIKKFGKSGKK